MDDDAIWKALGDFTRRSILDLLTQGPRTTGSLVDAFPTLSRFAVMKHLGVLEDANLISWRKEGRERWNSLNAIPLQVVYERWVNVRQAAHAAALLELAHLAETESRVQTTGAANMSTEIRSFDVTSQLVINTDQATVWKILTTRMGDWAQPPYRAYEAGDRIDIDLRPGGLMVETSKDGSSTVWGAITSLTEGTSVQFSGHCLMDFAWGTFTFSLEPDGDGTKATIHHIAIGPMNDDQGNGYRGGWETLLGDLKTLAEREG